MSVLPSTLRLLCLDLDDTILDDSWSLQEAWDLVARLVVAADPKLDVALVRQQIKRTTRWYWSDPERERARRVDLPRARHEIVTFVLEALDRPNPVIAAEAARCYTEHRTSSLRLLEGALDALARLRQQVPRLVLITNGASAPQRAKIERFELSSYFDHIQVEEEFGVGKPDPRVFESVLSRFAVDAEASCMVGDNYRCDVLGSLEVGMQAVWIERSGVQPPPSLAPRSFARLRSIVELVALLTA